MSPPRVRIAPSPTGDPHVGTAYIALFNYAFAHKHGGTFVLRIEDTDRLRSTEGSEQAIFEALRWVGLEWDEGPDRGGPFGPYRQSERTAIYRAHADVLQRHGAAYPCFCSSERLDEVRKAKMARGENPGYDGHCRRIAAEEARRRVEAGEPHVLRLAVPSDGETAFVDELRGEVRFSNAEIDDQVLVKSDGFPTYHLANVVDDHLMQITHVIRGEDWITSTPKHVLLYQAFGWEVPRFYHLGLLRNADKSKLSKRKNPVSVFHYRDLGYLPETFVNFLALMGFSMPGDRERFTLQEFIDAFDWARVATGGPVFDATKLDAFNGDDIRAMSPEDLAAVLRARLSEGARFEAIVHLTRERIARLDDFIPYTAFFYGGEVDYEEVLPKMKLKKRSRKEVVGILRTYVEELERDPRARGFAIEDLESFSREFCTAREYKPKELFTLLRLAATGRSATPPLFDTLHVLGKDRVRLRLRAAAERLAKEPDWTT